MKLVPEKETREILAANRNATFNLFDVYLKGRRAVPIAQFKVEDKRWRELPVVAVRCAQRLPAGAKVNLVLGPGVKTQSGIARGTPQKLAFEVRPAFIVKFNCERANKDAACLPVTPINLRFNAPVARDVAAGIRLKSESGTALKPELEPNVKTVESVTFKGPFPEKTRYTVELPRNFRDDAGREPENKASFPLSTATDESPPLAKFPGRFGILELNADPVLPVTVRNVEPALKGRSVEVAATGAKPVPGRTVRIADDEMRIMRRYQDFIRRAYERKFVTKARPYLREGEVSAIVDSDQAVSFELPRGGQNERALEVIGIPLKKPGFYIVELASPRLGRALHGEEKPYYVATSVLVTNLAVHLKHGRESSLVWVTSLDRGKPVAGAHVTVRDCTGHVWFEGKTDAEGIAAAGDSLPPPETVTHCGDYRRVLIAFAKTGEDVSFTYSDWNEGIQPWNFNLRNERRRGAPITIHTVFDRTLFRAGETVSMKHVARRPTGTGFSIPEPDTLPDGAEIEHVGTGQKVSLEVKFDAQGIAESTWKIPREAKLGTYRVSWTSRARVERNVPGRGVSRSAHARSASRAERAAGQALGREARRRGQLSFGRPRREPAGQDPLASRRARPPLPRLRRLPVRRQAREGRHTDGLGRRHVGKLRPRRRNARAAGEAGRADRGARARARRNGHGESVDRQAAGRSIGRRTWSWRWNTAIPTARSSPSPRGSRSTPPQSTSASSPKAGPRTRRPCARRSSRSTPPANRSRAAR